MTNGISNLGKMNLENATQSLQQGKQSAVLEKSNSATDRNKIRELANDFESLFLEVVLKSMRSSVQKSGLVDGGNGEEIYQSLLDTEYAKSMAGQRSTGLADAIEKQLFSLSQTISNSSQKSAKDTALKTYTDQASKGLR